MTKSWRSPRCSTRWAWTSSKRVSHRLGRGFRRRLRDRETGQIRHDLRAGARQFQGYRPLLGGRANAVSPRIHTFIGTSPQHRAIPNLTMDEMADRIHETVTHARNLCDNVQWSPMDATRTEWDYLKRVVEIAIRAGATTINIPDTVGYTAPVESADLIRRLIAECEGGEDVIFATHCHNDLGMATANSWPPWRAVRGRSNARSTVWASARATQRWKRS
jgi:hypothetical protein